MRRQVTIAAATLVALVAAGLSAAAGAADSGPSGSGYPENAEGWRDGRYGVGCADGQRVDLPDGTSVFVYDGANGTEMCFQQRDADGYETGPLSGRIWASDGIVHADAPTRAAAPFVDLGDRTEVSTDGQTIGLTTLRGDNGYGPASGRTTIEPLEGHIHREHEGGSETGYGSATSDTWIGPDGYRSDASTSDETYDEYRSSSEQASVGADGVHYHRRDDYYAGYYFDYYSEGYYHHDAHSSDADVDGDGAAVSKSDDAGDEFEGYVIAVSPSDGVAANRRTAGFDDCYQYGASDQGVTWNPVGAPGSQPTVVNSDDHPPCA